MEIQGISQGSGAYHLKNMAKPAVLMEPKDSFVSSSSSDKCFRKADITNLIWRKNLSAEVKGCRTTEMGTTASGDRAVLLDVMLDSGSSEKRFTGNIVPAEDGKFYAVTVRDLKDPDGKTHPLYSLAKMDESGQALKETPVFERASNTPVELTGSGDGRVTVCHNDKLEMFDKDGNKMWDCPRCYGHNTFVEFAGDGTTYVLDRLDQTGNILRSIAPDGSENWNHKTSCIKMTLNENGDICLADRLAKYQVFHPDGSADNPVNISEDKFITKTFSLGNGETVFQTESPSRWLRPEILIHADGKQVMAWSPDRDENLQDVTCNEKNGDFYAISSGNDRKDHLYSIGRDGKTKWKIDLPSKTDLSSKYRVSADNKGNIYLIMNKPDNITAVPDSYKSSFPSAPNDAFDLKGVNSMITCFSPDGKIQWQHKMNREPGWKIEPVATKAGNILMPGTSEGKVTIITTDAEKFEDMQKDKLHAAIDEASREMKAENGEETKNIRIDAEKKVINIGGVELKIN